MKLRGASHRAVEWEVPIVMSRCRVAILLIVIQETRSPRFDWAEDNVTRGGRAVFEVMAVIVLPYIHTLLERLLTALQITSIVLTAERGGHCRAG